MSRIDANIGKRNGAAKRRKSHKNSRHSRAKLLWIFVVLLVAFVGHAAEKKIVLIAGKPSHGPGEHEFRAGSLLLKKCLDQVPGIVSVVHSNGWPKEASALEGAAAVLIYADGGAGHPAIQGDHRQILDDLAKKAG